MMAHQPSGWQNNRDDCGTIGSAGPPSARRSSPTKIALCLAFLSLVGAVVLVWQVYSYAYQATSDSYLASCMGQAHRLANEVDRRLDEPDEAVLDSIRTSWQASVHPADEMLWVLDSSAVLLLHSGQPDRAGLNVGEVGVLGFDGQPAQPLRSLIQSGTDGIGQITVDSGEEQLAAFTAAPRRGWCVGVGRSKLALASSVHAGLRPFLIGLGVVGGLLMPLSLLLFYLNHRTAQRRLGDAVDALRESRDKFQNAIKDSPVMVSHQDADLRYTWFCNPPADLSYESFMGKCSQEVFDDPEEARLFDALNQGVLDTGIPAHQEIKVHLDGRELCFDVAIEPRLDREDRVIGITSVLADVTESAQVRAALYTSERRHSQLVDAMPGVVFQVRRSSAGAYRLVDVSQACIDLCGLAPEQLKADLPAVMSMIHPEGLLRLNEAASESLKTAEPVILELQITDALDTERWLCAQVQAQPTQDGGVIWTGFVTDISEQKRADARRDDRGAQLLRDQKLEAVATLSAGIAHDLNNALTTILGYAGIARSHIPKNHQAISAFDGIAEGVRQANRITRTLSMFGKEAHAERSKVNSKKTILEMLELLQRLLPSSLEFNFDVEQLNGCWIDADAVQIQQALMNLAMNANEAMPSGGTLQVSGRHLTDEVANRWQGIDAAAFGLLELTVEDNGAGMSDQTKHHMFEPFFSTKQGTKHVGLGLSAVHGIVQGHGGCIEVESDLHQGTRVTIALPCCGPAESKRPTKGILAECNLGSGRCILLAEDNELINQVIASALCSVGYRLLRAFDGDQAMALFAEHGDFIDLAVLDLDLPKITGSACLDEMRLTRPALPAVIISGGIDQDSSVACLENTVLLQKPFGVAGLLKVIGEALPRSVSS